MDDPYRQVPAATAPPRSDSTRGIAIAALVLSVLALVATVGLVAVGVAAGGLFAADLKGTLPQVVDGQPYPGDRLEAEVGRVIRADFGDVGSMQCPDVSRVAAGGTVVSTGEVDGFGTTVTVSFEDDAGHFRLEED